VTHCRVISTIDNRLRSIYSRNCALKFYKYANGKPWYGNKTWGYISLTLSRGRWRAEMPNRHCSPTPDPRDGGSRHQITPVSAALFAILFSSDLRCDNANNARHSNMAAIDIFRFFTLFPHFQVVGAQIGPQPRSFVLSAYFTANAYSVVNLNSSPLAKAHWGKSGIFGVLGENCVSRQKPPNLFM